jgi:VIT1/CCC1 family predicted Fe2+/Mn2+ transporter
MKTIIGITCAVAGAACLIFGLTKGRVSLTRENATFWGIGIGLTVVGLTLLLKTRMDTPSYWDGPNILRLTSRPIPA